MPSISMRAARAGSACRRCASTSSRCPLPSTPAIPKISPAAHRRGRGPTTVTSPRSSATVRSRTCSRARPGCAGPLSISKITSRPTMSVARLCCVAVVGIGGADDAPVPQHRDAVGDREHLAQLVGDEHDRLALVDEAADDAEELVDLARREHGRRLVEDEDVGVAEQRLQQLDALLLADREVLDLGVGVDVEPVLLAELARCGRGRCRGRAPARGAARRRARRSRRR